MTCAYCGTTSVFNVAEAGESVRLCGACLDKRYPELRLGTLTKVMLPQSRRTGKCPNCGWTEHRLVETGMLGCPLCYEAFSDDIWKQFGIERTESAWATT